MDLSCRFLGDVAILDLIGRFVVTAGETEVLLLRSAVGKLIGEDRIFVALNLTRVTSIDAHGLGELVAALATLRNRGGQLVLIAPSRVVSKMLSVTRLNTVLPSCDSELDALCRLRCTLGEPSLACIQGRR